MQRRKYCMVSRGPHCVKDVAPPIAAAGRRARAGADVNRQRAGHDQRRRPRQLRLAGALLVQAGAAAALAADAVAAGPFGARTARAPQRRPLVQADTHLLEEVVPMHVVCESDSPRDSYRLCLPAWTSNNIRPSAVPFGAVRQIARRLCLCNVHLNMS